MVIPYIRSDFFVCPHPIYMDIYSKCEYNCVFCRYKLSEGTYRKVQCSKNLHSLINDDFEKDLVKLLNNSDNPVTKLLKRGVPVMLSGKCEPFCPSEFSIKATKKAMQILHNHGVNIALETRGILQNTMNVIKDVDAAVNISLTPGDDGLCKLLEPEVPSYSLRFAWAREFRENGIWVGIKGEPIIPTVNDSQAQVEYWADRCANAEVCHVNFHDFNFKNNEITVLAQRFDSIGYPFLPIVKGIDEWPKIGQMIMRVVKSRGLAVSSPDWVNFGTQNSCIACCGLDQKFPRNDLTWQFALTVLNLNGSVDFETMKQYNTMGKAHEKDFREIWRNHDKHFTLASVNGIIECGKDEEGLPKFAKGVKAEVPRKSLEGWA